VSFWVDGLARRGASLKTQGSEKKKDSETQKLQKLKNSETKKEPFCWRIVNDRLSKCSGASVEEQERTAPGRILKTFKRKMRKAKPKKRVILPDPVFNDKKVSKFVNHLMYDGKKSISYEIFYNALDTVKGKMQNEEKSALEIWKQALDNITPQVEVKSRRIGGATFQVPTEIRPDRKESISMKNMISFARKRSGKSMADKLAAEIMDAYNNQGGAFKRKEDMHRMAEANRAFAHFRF
jgi:small subunit ribosomal protein S7